MGVPICRGRSESMVTQTFLLYSVWRLEYIWKICILSALRSIYEEKKMARGIIDLIAKQIAWNRAFRNLAIDELQKATRKEEGENMSEDLIRRSDAIEAIELVDWYHQNRNKDIVSGANSREHQAWYKADDVYKALEAVPSTDRLQGWIPCSERLPKDEGIFLVTMETYVFNEYSYPVGTSFYSPSFRWLNASLNKVLAWMPLPEPWKGEE